MEVSASLNTEYYILFREGSREESCVVWAYAGRLTHDQAGSIREKTRLILLAREIQEEAILEMTDPIVLDSLIADAVDSKTLDEFAVA